MRRVPLLVVLSLVAAACAPDGAATSSSTTTTTLPSTTTTTEATTTTTIPVATTVPFEDPQVAGLLYDVSGIESGSVAAYSGPGSSFDIVTEFFLGTVALHATGQVQESIDGNQWREVWISGTTTAWVDADFLVANTTAVVPFDESPCSRFGSPSAEIARSAPNDSDADHIAQIWQIPWPDCTRVVVALGSSFDFDWAAPLAAEMPGDVSVEAFSTWARVTLPDVQWTRTDGAEDIGDATVVVSRAAEDGLTIDIHAGAPAEYFARFLSDPARIVVDILSTNAAAVIVAPPVVGDGVILSEGLPPAVAMPVTISGYSRWFEATGLVIVRVATAEQGQGDVVGAVVTGDTVVLPGPGTEWGVMASDWLDAWGIFSFDLSGLGRGDYELFIGECRTVDGTDECDEVGVYVPITVGG